MTTLDFKLSVLLLREGEVWVAQCLDHDIAAQGRTIAEAKEAFARTFAGQVAVDLYNKVAPLKGFAPAPAMYWDKFKQGERLLDRQTLFVPPDSLPPAFMIHAMADDLRISA